MVGDACSEAAKAFHYLMSVTVTKTGIRLMLSKKNDFHAKRKIDSFSTSDALMLVVCRYLSLTLTKTYPRHGTQ